MRIVWMALLAMALPFAALADNSVDFTNSDGTLSGSSAGLVLSGSELIAVNGLNGGGLITGQLGTVSLSTGSLISGSGSLQNGASFNGGGSFQIVSNGSGGIPSGVLFQGSFSGPVSWTLTTVNGIHYYILTGDVQGTWYNGSTGSGIVNMTFDIGKGYFNGNPIKVTGSGDSIISSVPEPGTLGLLGTGLVGLAGLLHRKLKT
jgi:hypothetical protein